MSEQNNGVVDTLIDQRVAKDAEFRAHLQTLTDEDEKNNIIEAKRKEVLEAIVSEGGKHKELADNYKTRAENAERDLKKLRPADAKKGDDDLSKKDLYALMQAKIPEDDVDDITEFAKFKGITVTEALKSNVVKTMLADKAETRRTAEATQTRSTRQTSRGDGASIIANAKAKGEEGLPSKGSDDAEEMFWARRGGRRS